MNKIKEGFLLGTGIFIAFNVLGLLCTIGISVAFAVLGMLTGSAGMTM